MRVKLFLRLFVRIKVSHSIFMDSGKKKKISLEQLYPAIKETLDNGGNVEIPITGTSMLPLLVWGRDSVEISQNNKINIGDIIFYRRVDGSFVLHRIIGKDSGGFILCGDNQWIKEYGITEKNIVGVVKTIRRNGKNIDINNTLYKLYSKIWIKIFHFRKYILIFGRKMKKLFGR